MKFLFDAKADVLYCSFGDPREAISVELENGSILRLDPQTDEVIGVTVIDFMKRADSVPPNPHGKTGLV